MSEAKSVYQPGSIELRKARPNQQVPRFRILLGTVRVAQRKAVLGI